MGTSTPRTLRSLAKASLEGNMSLMAYVGLIGRSAIDAARLIFRPLYETFAVITRPKELTLYHYVSPVFYTITRVRREPLTLPEMATEGLSILRLLSMVLAA